MVYRYGSNSMWLIPTCRITLSELLEKVYQACGIRSTRERNG